MKRRAFPALAGILAMLSACGGGGGGSSTSSGTGTGSGGGGTSTGNGCTLAERQSWVLSEMNEWYLFPETLPSTSPSASTLTAYVDALTATARSQNRDRYFTYVTSIAEENAYYSSGATAGFGVRFAYDTAARRVFVLEAYEGAPALTAGIDRGAELIAIGTSEASLQTVSNLMASGGAQAVVDALGPSTAGTTRVLRITDSTGTRNLTVTKADYSLTPISSRYGTKILDDGGKKVGYVNMRTFIDTSNTQLRNAFAQFRAQGVTEVIVDLRYNGGGLVSVAELFGDLLGRNRSTSDVFSITTFRPSKSSNNETDRFGTESSSIAPTKLAFIGTGGTASASELVINSMRPYLGANMALIGSNTYGKPVGQIARDRAACDDRLRVVAFSTQNANNEGFYYTGLANVAGLQTCQAADDYNYPLGDVREASVARALDFLAGRSCTRISEAGVRTASVDRAASATPAARELLIPRAPGTAQRESPGSF